MISIGDTLGFDGMKGVFRLATALWKEEVSRHGPGTKPVCKGPERTLRVRSQPWSGGMPRTRIHTSSVGRTAFPATPPDSQRFPTNYNISHLPALDKRTHTHTHTCVHTCTHMLHAVYPPWLEYVHSTICPSFKKFIFLSFLHSLFPLWGL